MQIILINVAAKLHVQGINLDVGAGVDALEKKLQTLMPIGSWGYSFTLDSLSIEVPDGTPIPDLSAYGEVVPNGSP